MPGYGAQLAEIDLAEGDEENEEHEQGKNAIADGSKQTGCTIEHRHIGKHQIKQRSRSNGNRKRPVFYEADDCHRWDKITKKREKSQTYK